MLQLMPTVSKVVLIPFDSFLSATSNTLFIGDMPENVDEEKMKTFLDMTFMSNNGIRLCGPAEKKIGFVEFDSAEPNCGDDNGGRGNDSHKR